MERALITGATGFIGRHCLSRLIDVAGEVHATTRKSTDCDVFVNVKWHNVDLLQSDQVITLIKKINPTHLLHLAWNVEEGVFWNTSENLKWLKSSIDLFEVFYNNGGKRLVMAGSCSEYNLHQSFLSEEYTNLKPISLYACCKHALQTILEAYTHKSGNSYAWGRIFYVYGPHEKPGRLVPSVIRSLLANKESHCTHGNQIRDYLYVEDVSDAFVRLLNSNVQGPVNIASGVPIKLKWIIYRIADLIGNRRDSVKLGALPIPKNEPPVIFGDVRRLGNELDWRPNYDLDTGLKNTISWCRNK